MTDEQLPGEHLIPLEAPVPPQLAEACGYRGEARHIGLYWTPHGDEVFYDDGRRSGTGNSSAFLTYRRHPKVAPYLDGYNLGSSDAEAEHILLLDRQLNLASIAPVSTGLRFLTQQHPPLPELSPYELEERRRMIDQAISRGWREVRVNPEMVSRAMKEHRQAIVRIMAYLDRWPDV